MLGLTTLGAVHTAISLIALAAGIAAFVRHGAISLRTRPGQVYVVTTVLTCLTGFGIFQRGGFNEAHVLGIVTLVVLVVAAAAGRDRLGRLSRYIEAVGYSATFFFHMIPAFNETGSRLPLGAPLISGPDDPKFQAAVGAAFLVFLIGAFVQVRRLRHQPGLHAG
jgi:uncharacterized membrane protein